MLSPRQTILRAGHRRPGGIDQRIDDGREIIHEHVVSDGEGRVARLARKAELQAAFDPIVRSASRSEIFREREQARSAQEPLLLPGSRDRIAVGIEVGDAGGAGSGQPGLTEVPVAPDLVVDPRTAIIEAVDRAHFFHRLEQSHRVCAAEQSGLAQDGKRFTAAAC